MAAKNKLKQFRQVCHTFSQINVKNMVAHAQNVKEF